MDEMTEEAQGQFAQVNLSIYDWHIILKILEEEVCTVNSVLQDSAVRVYEAIATQLSEKPVRILKPSPRPRPGSRESPYKLMMPSPTLKDKIQDRFQRLRGLNDD